MRFSSQKPCGDSWTFRWNWDRVSFACFPVQCPWSLLILVETGMQITCGTLGLSTATVKLVDADGKEHVACSMGAGPVDSAYKAIDLIVKVLFQTNVAHVYIKHHLIGYLKTFIFHIVGTSDFAWVLNECGNRRHRCHCNHTSSYPRK